MYCKQKHVNIVAYQKKYYVFIFVLLVHICRAQHHISKYELCWSIVHPFTAFKIKQQLPNIMVAYTEVKFSQQLDTLQSGGKLDAFRHTYAMAYLARSIKNTKLKKLGVAHEKGNKQQFNQGKCENGELPDSLACEMDLRNNTVGITMASA